MAVSGARGKAEADPRRLKVSQVNFQAEICIFRNTQSQRPYVATTLKHHAFKRSVLRDWDIAAHENCTMTTEPSRQHLVNKGY